MSADDEASEVARYAVELARIAGTNLIDALFLVVVVAINWAAGLGVKQLGLDGTDLVFQRCLQVVFFVSTMTAVVIQFVRNLYLAVVRVLRSEP